ncbi:DUF2306 domain-containing protein [Rhodophyticola sp. CCM32]|uniref:DUF2306 domain-containing protein n=1 Tax=Rhodophyticola sp. CCM32 TaxID=2916397 RepID=UPI00143E09D7|nr:DUF2306 domain-containing protein [Rhodophyticola sp. CCM32]
MTIDPILSASPAVQVHIAAACLAILLGPFAIYRRQRDRIHKLTGYIWIMAMMLLAGSSLTIPAHVFPIVGMFGPIHLLSIAVFYILWKGYRHIRAGRRALHAQSMRALYWNSLGIAGAFTFLPGRVMNRVFFAGAERFGYVMILLLLAGVLAHTLGQRKARRPV